MNLRVLAALVLVAVPGWSPLRVDVPRWEPHDVAFTGAGAPANPFSVTFSATATGPGGLTMEVPGFHDGGTQWKIRVAPIAEGAWSLTTHSSLPSLDGQTASFVCGANPNPKVHGGLRVDPAHPHHFVFEDGTRFQPAGYECDWLWALDLASGDPALPTLNPFLDKIAAAGFNYVLLNGYAHDTSWRSGSTGTDDYGPPPMYAWGGTNAAPDHSRMNLAYWQHYDRVIDALYRRGMVAHLMIKVYNKSVTWPVRASANDDLYFGWLVARYSAYPNIVWDFSKEAHNETDLTYKIGRLNFLKARDPYHRLRTVHDDDASYNGGSYNGILDYRSDQQHGSWGQTILSQRQQRAWPIVNVEYGYEQGPGGPTDKTYGVAQAPEEVVRRAWEIRMAGGYDAYYYTYTAWDVIRPGDTPPGYALFKRLHDFFEGTAFWRMDPVANLASQGTCLAEPGKEYVVSVNPGQDFTLNLQGLAAPLTARWFQPLTGAVQDAGTLPNGLASLHIPAGWNVGPVVLHVGPAATSTPPPPPPPPPPGPGTSPMGLDSFSLMNADTGQVILEPLGDGALLNLGTLPTRNLNVRANTTPATVGSVVFGLDGNPGYRTETSAPYALAGDVAGTFNAWTPAVGAHSLSATPYTLAGGSGAAGTPLTVTFTVLDDPTTPSTGGSGSPPGGGTPGGAIGGGAAAGGASKSSSSHSLCGLGAAVADAGTLPLILAGVLLLLAGALTFRGARREAPSGGAE